MNTKRSLLSFIFTLLFCVTMSGQISTEELPYSFNLRADNLQSPELFTLPPLNMEEIEKEDLDNEPKGVPPRFGYPIPFNKDITNSGTWTQLPDGGRLWQLRITSPGALSINLLYDKFWLPEGGKLFIYSTNKEYYIGAFTSINNKGDRTEPAGFATSFIFGDDITLEYYEPFPSDEEAIISIAYVVHGYRYIYAYDPETRGFGDSGNCQVNTICEEGVAWGKEKNAVALVIIDGTSACSGALMNNTLQDDTPYLLTADHCLKGYDAINSPNLNYWTFYWNYESPECTTKSPGKIKSTSAATVVANNSVSDFALLKLTEHPQNLSSVSLFYLGWDIRTSHAAGGVGIHHPRADVKKISTHSIIPATTNCFTGSSYNNNNFWKINWSATRNGFSVTEGGSSGSPLLNSLGYCIGQLYGSGYCANPDCSNPANDIGNYGKIGVSWTGSNATDPRRRLKDWLSPNSNVQYLTGRCASTNLLTFLNAGSLSQAKCQDKPGESQKINWGSANFIWGKGCSFTAHIYCTDSIPLYCTASYIDFEFYAEWPSKWVLKSAIPSSGAYTFTLSDGCRINGFSVISRSWADNITFNPQTSVYTINFTQEEVEEDEYVLPDNLNFALLNKDGKEIRKLRSPYEETKIDVSNLENGEYILQVYDDEGIYLINKEITIEK